MVYNLHGNHQAVNSTPFATPVSPPAQRNVKGEWRSDDAGAEERQRHKKRWDPLASLAKKPRESIKKPRENQQKPPLRSHYLGSEPPSSIPISK